MKKLLMLLLMLSVPAAYAGSDTEEEKSSFEKKGVMKHPRQMEEERLPHSQPFGSQESSLNLNKLPVNQSADSTIQGLIAKIRELELSNQGLKAENNQLKNDLSSVVKDSQSLKTYLQGNLISVIKYSGPRFDEMYQVIQNKSIASVPEQDDKREWVIYLIKHGFLDMVLLKLPDDFSHHSLEDRNDFRQRIKGIQRYVPYVVENQAEIIRRLVEDDTPDEQWIQTYQDLYNQGYPNDKGAQMVRLEYKYKKYDNLKWPVQVMGLGNLKVRIGKLPDNFAQSPLSERHCFRQGILEFLQPYEPYIAEEQAEVIHKLMELNITDDQVNEWAQVYKDFLDQGNDDNGKQAVFLEHKDIHYRFIGWAIDLMSTGYNEGNVMELPDNFAQQSLANRNYFRKKATRSVQPFEPYVIESQAKAIRRLVALDVTDDQVNDWIQAYKDFYNLGYLNDEGKQMIRMEYKYKEFMPSSQLKS